MIEQIQYEEKLRVFWINVFLDYEWKIKTRIGHKTRREKVLTKDF